MPFVHNFAPVVTIWHFLILHHLLGSLYLALYPEERIQLAQDVDCVISYSIGVFNLLLFPFCVVGLAYICLDTMRSYLWPIQETTPAKSDCDISNSPPIKKSK